MSGVNKAIIVGNLGKDPEVRHLENDMVVANFTVATSETYKDRKTGDRVTQTEWHNVVLWRGLAEVAEKYLKKGSQVYVEGKLQTRSWEDKEGNTRYTTEIVGNNLTMLGKRNEGESDTSSPPREQASALESPTQNSSKESAPSKSAEEDDDLPF